MSSCIPVTFILLNLASPHSKRVDIVDLKRSSCWFRARVPGTFDKHSIALPHKGVLLELEDVLVVRELLHGLSHRVPASHRSDMVRQSFDRQVAPLNIGCAEIKEPLKIAGLERSVPALDYIDSLRVVHLRLP